MKDSNNDVIGTADVNTADVNMADAKTGASPQKTMTKRTAYTYFIVCMLLEQVGIVALNYCEGFTVPLPTAVCIVAFGLCYACFGKCLKVINLAVAFAVWSGVAVIFTAILSVTLIHHPLNTGDIIGLALVIIGIVGMNLKA